MEIKDIKVSGGNWYSAEEFMEYYYSYEVSSPMFRVTFNGDFSNNYYYYRYALMCDYNSGTKKWEVFFIDNREGKKLELAEEVKSKCLELAKRELENFDKMTFTEWCKDFGRFEYCTDICCGLLKDFYGYGDEDAYKDIENEYNSMLKELNDKLYAKYKNKLNQI